MPPDTTFISSRVHRKTKWPDADAGFQNGVRVAEEKFYGDGDFRNTDGKPEWGNSVKAIV